MILFIFVLHLEESFKKDMAEEAYLEDISVFYHNRTLPQYESKLIQVAKEAEYYEKNAVYSLKVYSVHLEHVKSISCLDDITSTVARCVEYGLMEQLEYLLSKLTRLLSIATHEDGVTILDQRLFLRDPKDLSSEEEKIINPARKFHLSVYLLARKFGFMDIELEKRISLFQRIYRERKSGKTQMKPNLLSIKYNGPFPEDFFRRKDGSINYEHSPRYYGYRHVLYFLKWNRTKRYQILSLIKRYWWGDCRYQAYVDYLETKTEENLSFKQGRRNKIIGPYSQ